MTSPAESSFSRPRLHPVTGHYGMEIGYQLDEAGVRKRRNFSFGRDENAAIAAAVAKQKEWAEIKRGWAKERRGLEENLGGYDWSKPVWPDSPLIVGIMQRLRADDEIRRRLQRDADLAAVSLADERNPDVIDQVWPLPNQPQSLTIAQAKDRFIAAKRAQVGLASGVGIKPTTFNGIVTMLNAALGISTSVKNRPKVVRTPIDLDRPVNSLTFADLEAFRNFWLALPSGISVRTAINYCNHFRSLLTWCDQQDDIVFDLPKRAANLWRFKGMKGRTKIADYEPEVLKAIFAFRERVKLYALLGLNCGYYQQDISDLTHDDLVTHGGRTYLWRGRSKTTHQNDFETLHVLWPETSELLTKHMTEKGNAHGRLLLNKEGLPLVREAVDDRKQDAITGMWDKMIRDTPIRFSFRQFRQLGFNAVKRISGREDVARLYAGHATPGVARHYDRNDFEPLADALQKWRDELKADGVL